MEKTLSKSAVEKVIQDRIDWWETELNSANRELLVITQRFKDDSITMDGLILYTQRHKEHVADIQTRLMELNNILNAIDRL